jgi:predicted amidohydrolase
MKMASVQFAPAINNIAANIEKHIFWTTKARKAGADLVLFPEMSLTGYELERAGEIAFEEKDSRLSVLADLSKSQNITIVCGAPVKLKNGKLCIGSFIIKPDETIQIYAKKYLHTGEDKFFETDHAYDPQINIAGNRISFAICADITHPEHSRKAFERGTDIYLASIFFTPKGIAEGLELLQKYAQEYQMNVLMSNYTGESYGYAAAGQSSYWNNRGQLIAYLNAEEEDMLVVT